MRGDFIEKPRQNRGEVTPQESEVINRYVTLFGKVHDIFTREEHEAFGQELRDLKHMLESGEGMSPAFREDMLKQTTVLEKEYLNLKRRR